MGETRQQFILTHYILHDCITMYYYKMLYINFDVTLKIQMTILHYRSTYVALVLAQPPIASLLMLIVQVLTCACCFYETTLHNGIQIKCLLLFWCICSQKI